MEFGKNFLFLFSFLIKIIFNIFYQFLIKKKLIKVKDIISIMAFLNSVIKISWETEEKWQRERKTQEFHVTEVSDLKIIVAAPTLDLIQLSRCTEIHLFYPMRLTYLFSFGRATDLYCEFKI